MRRQRCAPASRDRLGRDRLGLLLRGIIQLLHVVAIPLLNPIIVRPNFQRVLVRQQDSDVATDFHAALDTPAGRRKPGRAKPPTAQAPSRVEGGGGEGEDEGRDGGEEEDSDDEEEKGGWGSDEF